MYLPKKKLIDVNFGDVLRSNRGDYDFLILSKTEGNLSTLTYLEKKHRSYDVRTQICLLSTFLKEEYWVLEGREKDKLLAIFSLEKNHQTKVSPEILTKIRELKESLIDPQVSN